MSIPRLRMFAGPKGSGKSTLNSVLSKELLGVYINPDEIEKEIRKFDFLDMLAYRVETNKNDVLSFFKNHPLLERLRFLFDGSHLAYRSAAPFHPTPSRKGASSTVLSTSSKWNSR